MPQKSVAFIPANAQPFKVRYSFPNPYTDSVRFQTWVTKYVGLVGEDDDYVFRNRSICQLHFKEIYHYQSIEQISRSTWCFPGDQQDVHSNRPVLMAVKECQPFTSNTSNIGITKSDQYMYTIISRCPWLLKNANPKLVTSETLVLLKDESYSRSSSPHPRPHSQGSKHSDNSLDPPSSYSTVLSTLPNLDIRCLPLRRMKKRTIDDDNINEAITNVGNRITQWSQRQSQPQDRHDSFGQNVAHKLRNISNEQRIYTEK